jgi:hypothetical protein
MSERAQRSRSEMAKAVSRWKSAPSGATTDQRRDLWTALNEFIRQNGGSIVSLQFTSPVRVELVQGSSLAASLTAMGFDPIFVERVSRFGPIAAEPVLRRRRATTPTDGFRAVDIFELRLK